MSNEKIIIGVLLFVIIIGSGGGSYYTKSRIDEAERNARNSIEQAKKSQSDALGRVSELEKQLAGTRKIIDDLQKRASRLSSQLDAITATNTSISGSIERATGAVIESQRIIDELAGKL